MNEFEKITSTGVPTVYAEMAITPAPCETEVISWLALVSE